MAKNHPIIGQGTKPCGTTLVTPREAVLLGFIAEEIKKGVDAYVWRRKLELEKNLKPEYDSKGKRTIDGLTHHCLDIVKGWEESYCVSRRADPSYVLFNIYNLNKKEGASFLKIREEYLQSYGQVAKEQLGRAY
jgi:hypothetical protein